MAKQNNTAATSRFSQILSILRKNKIGRGVSPQKLRNIIEELGPTYIKLGQIMSMRSDILPPEYCEALTSLRTDVPPMDIGEVRLIVESSLGEKIEEVFSSFEAKPVGSASIAQAHCAVLRKENKKVVVKVQRVGIYDIMENDIVLLRRACGVIKFVGKTGDVLDFKMILNELWRAAQEEMNFKTEARNIREFHENNKNIKYITSPAVFDAYTSENVLVMENIGGHDINEVGKLEADGYDMREIARKLADNYMKQVMEDGYFHADPHPGNIKICEGKIAWIDFGMMGRLSERDRKLIISALEGMVHGDVGAVKDAVLALGEYSAPINHAKLYADLEAYISKYSTEAIGSINLEKAVSDMMQVAKSHKIAIPSGVTMLGRGLCTIEGVMADICPDINMLELIVSYMSSTMMSRIDWKREVAGGTYDLLESARRTLSLPSLFSNVLSSCMKGQLKTNTELGVSPDLKRTADRIVTKIALAIIAAALFIGSGILCTADIKPRVAGVPLLGAIGMFFAAVLTLTLVIDYLINRGKK